MHSWRILILPYIDHRAIYDRYCFDEPWDGPNNRELHELIVSTYACPSHPRRPETSYAAVLGPETAWRGARPMTRHRCEDGPDQTVHVVEVAAPAIHWMAPRDLVLDRMGANVNDPDGTAGPSSHHPGGANVLLLDGAVRFLKQTIEPAQVRALLTVAGGEDVGAF